MKAMLSPGLGFVRNSAKRVRMSFVVVLAVTLLPQDAKAVPIEVDLGTASSFAVLAGSTVTNTGTSIITGDVGVSPGTAITGFPPGIVVPPFTLHAADAVALQAQNDLTTAYNSAAGLAPTSNLTGQDLGGLTLVPGVYSFSSSAQLTGTLTLDSLGDPHAQFVFQIGSTLTTASNSSVLLTNSGDPCNVFFQVGSSATLGTGTDFVGNILALTSITLNTDADLDGRALARNGAVTLDTNDIALPVCAITPLGVPDTGSTLLLLSPVMASLVGVKRLFFSRA